MGEGAAPQVARGSADGEDRLADVSQALEALRLAWGDVYTFGYDGEFWAERPDRPGTLRADTAEELGSLLAGDFELHPPEMVLP